MQANKTDAQPIEALRLQYEELKTKKITAEANLKTSSDALEEIKREAREKYGTDDLDALRAKLKQMIEENETKRAAYQEHLTGIEAELEKIEAEHTQTAGKGPE